VEKAIFGELAKAGSDAHRLIKSNPKLFQFDLQADQGIKFLQTLDDFNLGRP
jgi:hypothetical protein